MCCGEECGGFVEGLIRSLSEGSRFFPEDY